LFSSLCELILMVSVVKKFIALDDADSREEPMLNEERVLVEQVDIKLVAPKEFGCPVKAALEVVWRALLLGQPTLKPQHTLHVLNGYDQELTTISDRRICWAISGAISVC
jgi:hypothetical protein